MLSTPPKTLAADGKRYPSSRKQAKENRQKVRAEFEANPDKPVAEVAKKIGVSDTVARAVKKEIADQNELPAPQENPVSESPNDTVAPAAPEPTQEEGYSFEQDEARRKERTEAYGFVERFWTQVNDFMGELRNRGREETMDVWIEETLTNHRAGHIDTLTDLLDNLERLIKEQLRKQKREAS